MGFWSGLFKGSQAERDDPYDPWDDLHYARSHFAIGSWAGRKVRGPMASGERVKVVRELEAAARKREDKMRGKNKS